MNQTMCKNTACLPRKTCYRYIAIPERVQEYFHAHPGSGIQCPQRIDVIDPSIPVRNWRDVDTEINAGSKCQPVAKSSYQF